MFFERLSNLIRLGVEKLPPQIHQIHAPLAKSLVQISLKLYRVIRENECVDVVAERNRGVA